MKKAPAASGASSSGGETILRVSGAADRFHRVNLNSRTESRSRSPKTLPSRMLDSAIFTGEQNYFTERNDINSSDTNTNFDFSSSIGNAPNPQNIDRADDGLPQITGSGLHMPPEILGRSEDPDITNTKKTPSSTHNSHKKQRNSARLADLNKAVRRRSFLAVKAIKSPAATKAAKEAVKGVTCPNNDVIEGNVGLNSTIFTTVIYGGMEVVFSHVKSHKAIAGVCSRTKILFQKLNLSSETPVVSITSNSSSGMLVVAHQDGVIKTYVPIKTDPISLDNSKRAHRPKSIFGRLRWVDGITLNAAEAFYHLSGKEFVKFCDRRNNEPGKLVDISSSNDCKILVAHRQQLAVYDAYPFRGCIEKNDFQTNNAATLLWTTVLRSKIVAAKMSGDGQAVVVVTDKADARGKHGAMTFIHDKDDGSAGNSVGVSSASIGIVYKPGPFLEHANPITRISFRGLGHVTPSANPGLQQGNDLLLTYCEKDSTARIFNQNSWHQLMFWTTPPCSRADWIRGSSAFSLGDLEPQLKSNRGRGYRNEKGRPKSVSSELSNATGSLNSGWKPSGAFRTSGLGSPISDAGAWIAEITFRGAYPALRLSRLSYMKRGNDDSQPAHFESIASILPAGSIIAESVLNADDMGLSIQGIWPAWNPWLSDSSEDEVDKGLGKSAMKFLGLSSVPPPAKGQGTFGEYYAGGTHSPPTELRLVTSHPENGHFVLMDFPLWGEDDFGAMELGSPIRNVLALNAVCALRNKRREKKSVVASMDYESSRLCADVKGEGRSISLYWRKEGCMSTYSSMWRDESAVFFRQHKDSMNPVTPDLIHDVSLIHVPLALPPLKMPVGASVEEKDAVVAIKWWPDDSFGGPPLLVAITKSQTIIVYEIPPPLFALEPTMPNFDSSNPQSSVASGSTLHENVMTEDDSDDEDSRLTRKEYEVLITPHPDFGLGLRLESPMDGLPAIAGSFKKNPLNDGILPAEKTGMIQLGDELLSVNGVNLENRTFDDIVATVRHVGAELGPGKALKMKFRPVPFDRSRKNSAVVHESFSVRSSPHSHCSRDNEKSADGSKKLINNQDTGSLAAMLYSSSNEAQQEFGRVIAMFAKGVTTVNGDDLTDRFIVIPWNTEASTSSKKLRAAAMMIHAYEDKVQFMRVELPAKGGQDKALILDLGTIHVLHKKDDKHENDEPVVIQRIMYTKNTGASWCFVICDSVGDLSFLYVDFAQKESKMKESHTGAKVHFELSHKQHAIASAGADMRHFRLCSSSENVLATVHENESSLCSIKVWHSRPDVTSDTLSVDSMKDNHFDKSYHESTIIVEPSESKSELVDFCFLTTGYLEAFPTIVAFLTSEAIVYQRRGSSLNWIPVLRISYPAILTSNWQSDFSNSFGNLFENMPMDAYPHLLRLVRANLLSYDEKNYMLSDWHPETILAHICTEVKGSRFALCGYIKRIFLWIYDKIDGALGDNLCSNVPLLVAPLASWGGEMIAGLESTVDEKKQKLESGGSFMTSLTTGSRATFGVDRDYQKLKRLYAILQTDDPSNFGSHGLSSDTDPSVKRAKKVAGFLTTLNADELLVLRAILNVVLNPPGYGVLDVQGQLCLTIYSIHKEINIEEDGRAKRKKITSDVSYQGLHVKRQISVESSEPKLNPQNASAGCIAALLSDYQGLIVDTIRQPGKKFDWSEIRNLRVPFWLRSDEKLRQLTLEIGQKTYRQTKDILKSAMFFIIAGKKVMLTNLAAADTSLSGRKFHKFLTTYDFSSKRGRVAAEKNAFSLLRKNQYDSAASFFLLAEPPMLKSAIETIATKMGDLDLAFLAARLVGNFSSSRHSSTHRGFGIVLGGGGGFAGSGNPSLKMKKDDDSFKGWKPHLCEVGKKFLLDRVLQSAKNDRCLIAVQYLWLGRLNEASNWLTGLINYSDDNISRFVQDVTVPQLRANMTANPTSRKYLMSTTNSLINLASGPILLKIMKANKRTRLASTIAISRSLVSAGVEIPALRSLMDDIDESDFHTEEQEQPQSTFSTSKIKLQLAPSTSILDEFNTAKNRTLHHQKSISNETPPSIFDSFDIPHAKTSRPPVSEASVMQSSIFDNFDVTPSKESKKSSSASKTISSSIFDSFDVPDSSKPKVSEPSSDITSSIFDSFDVPPLAKASGVTRTPNSDSLDSCRATKSAPFSNDINSTGVSNALVDVRTEESIGIAEFIPSPSIWIQWRKDLILEAAARRLIRELSTFCAPYYCDRFNDGNFGRDPLVTSEASQVLQFHCDGDELIKEVREQAKIISEFSNLECIIITERAIQILHSPHQCHRIFYVVLLLLASKKIEMVEDVLRSAAHSVIAECYSNAFCNNRVSNGRFCGAHFSTLLSQDLVANLSWQLELCLWIHRGGALQLSGLALNEVICSVRIGYFIASRNREFKVQEMIINESPDCLLDEKAGRQLWSSLKIISGGGQRENKVVGTGSGGWEFLVDCRRAHATELLRQRPTGSFIIRPHPQDHGVFTISFKTNLIPSDENRTNESSSVEESQSTTEVRFIRRDDVVQHAIIRLSDSGFRCGSFGPFGTLMDLLEAVSLSLPFHLRFDLPPNEGIIKDEGSKPSPNSAFLRKLGIQQAELENKTKINISDSKILGKDFQETVKNESDVLAKERKEMFGLFSELLVLHRLKKQLSAVAAAEYDRDEWVDNDLDDLESIGSISEDTPELGVEQEYAIASRIMRPLSTWCRMMEIEAGIFLSPSYQSKSLFQVPHMISQNKTDTEFELLSPGNSKKVNGGDSIIRRMIQPGSGVEFRTLRLGGGSDNAMVVLFSKEEAIAWLLNTGVDTTSDDALKRLKSMEENRVIEHVDLQFLKSKSYTTTMKRDEDDGVTEDESLNGTDSRYRLVDPWEVEPLESREAETRGASLGRNRLLEFSLSRISSCCEEELNTMDESSLLELWASVRGDISLTKALATVQPPWERSSGGDLLLCDGINSEPSIYENSIRVHLYRNSLFERMNLPQRFVALIQVELLDLKNLTSPGGSLSLTIYSLVRLKRARSSAPLTSKARTLDSVSTAPVKLAKTSGPNAPASWGSLVRFRYPLPENTDIEGKCYDRDCESLFKGPPSVLQISVYEKKFMSDSYLGGADIKLNSLSYGGQLEEWVPLRTEAAGINWFARIRLTLRFELMCLASRNQVPNSLEDLAPSVCHRRIQQLCRVGGAQFDLKQSVSTPDILSYFESYFEAD